MSLTNFYMQTTGSDLNAGSTTADSAVYTSTSGNWDGTSVFTPTDGSTPASSISAGDWCSVYVNAATTLVYIAQVSSVAAGVNGAITLSTTVKLGTAPSSGSGTRSIKAGGAWASPTPIMNGALGNNVAIPVPIKVNIKAGTYTRTASETCQLRGTTANIAWIDGYNSSPGDLDNLTTAPTLPLFSYNSTFRITFNADFMLISNISFLGNVSAAVVTGNGQRFHRIKAENTSTNTAALAFSSQSVSQAITYSWFKATSSGNLNGVVDLGSGGYLVGCTAIGGGLAGFRLTGSGSYSLVQCVAQSNTGSGISFTGASPNILVSNCSIQSPTVDGILIATNTSTNIIISGNIIAGCGGFGIKQSSSSPIPIFVCNDFFNNSSGNFSGNVDDPSFFQQNESNSPYASSTDPTLVSGSLARNNGFPGNILGLSSTSYLDAGAVQSSASSGVGTSSYVFGG